MPEGNAAAPAPALARVFTVVRAHARALGLALPTVLVFCH